MKIFFVLSILSLLVSFRVIIILKDFLYILLCNILRYINYTKNKNFMRYSTIWFIILILIFSWNNIWTIMLV